MIRSSVTAAEQHSGYIAFTDAATEGPLLIHVDDIDLVWFAIDGGRPFAVNIMHTRDGKSIETIVSQVLHEVLELIRLASQDSWEIEESRKRGRRVNADFVDF